MKPEIYVDSIIEGKKGKYLILEEIQIYQDVQIFKGRNERNDSLVFVKSQDDISDDQLQISTKLSNQNLLHVVSIIEVFYSEQYGKHFIITEYTEFKDLYYYNRKYKIQPNQDQIRDYMKQITRGLQELHNQNYIHRDLKVENIVVFKDTNDQIKLKICDLGLTKNESKAKTRKIGTSYYMAPEMIKGQYDISIDIWSLGIIWFYLLTKRQIFAQTTEEEILQQIELSNQGFIDNMIDTAKSGIEDISDEDKYLLKQMLSIKSEKRPDTQMILQHLNNTGFTKIAKQILKVQTVLEQAYKVEESRVRRVDSDKQIICKAIEEMEKLIQLYKSGQRIQTQQWQIQQ